MIDVLTPISAGARIERPKSSVPIAIIGAGVITDFGHIPAYQALGLTVAGIFDLNAERAAEVAARHGIDRVYATVDEVFADPQAPIVDIAVFPWAQPELVMKGIAHGRHMLCQKPFALDLDEAVCLATAVRESGIKVAVQQQLRYDEGIAAARSMVQAGWIGDVTALTFHVNISTDWSSWPWLVQAPRLEIQYHSIHYLDAVRSILGNPARVFAVLGRTEGQIATGETRSMSTLIFESGARALLHVNHENHWGDATAEFRIDGTSGSIRGTLGLLYDYPHGRPDTLEVRSSSLPTDGWLPYPVTSRWLPDAFGGPMADLQNWVAGGDPASTRLEDNLNTLALVQALYASAESGQAVDIAHP